MPNRNIVGDYRYNYQGQELDQETGKVAFQLRLYDPRINRWMAPDPAQQYPSPYMSMGNNWVSQVDPDGAKADDWYVNNETGELEWHNTSASIDGLTWVGTNSASFDYLSSMSSLMGGSGSIPGADVLAMSYYQITGGFNDGLAQRGKDFVSFMEDPKGRTLQGIANTIDSGGAFINDFVASGESDLGLFTANRLYDGASSMTLYDWSYAAGYSAPDIALSFAGGYALSTVKLGFSLRPRASMFKIHPRLIGQDVAHRSATFFRQEIISNGSFGIKNYKTIYFNHRIGNRNFSIGINPWKRTIFHEGPGIFK